MLGLDETRQRGLKQLLFACAIIIVVLGYSLGAYLASSMIIEYDGGLWWRSTPEGSLFPVPHGPGILTVLSQVSSVDAFIYRYLLRIPLLVVVDALVICATWLRVKKRS
jgi:hypothetical protein